jgi:hypothetical protein
VSNIYKISLSTVKGKCPANQSIDLGVEFLLYSILPIEIYNWRQYGILQHISAVVHSWISRCSLILLNKEGGGAQAAERCILYNTNAIATGLDPWLSLVHQSQVTEW